MAERLAVPPPARVAIGTATVGGQRVEMFLNPEWARYFDSLNSQVTTTSSAVGLPGAPGQTGAAGVGVSLSGEGGDSVEFVPIVGPQGPQGTQGPALWMLAEQAASDSGDSIMGTPTTGEATGTGLQVRQGTPTITTPVINGMTGDNSTWLFGTGTNTFARDSSGNIGLGSFAPGKKLEVRGVGTLAAIRLLESGTLGVSWDVNVGLANEMLFTNNNASPLTYRFANGSVKADQHFLSTAPVTETAATHTVATTTTYLIANRAGTITVTLPTAASFTGRALYIKTIQAQTVVSAASDVVPLNGGAAGTAILAATIGKWAQLVSNGTSWEIMTAN